MKNYKDDENKVIIVDWSVFTSINCFVKLINDAGISFFC